VDPDDNDIFMTPAPRLCELAEILAAGIIRLHVREALPWIVTGRMGR